MASESGGTAELYRQALEQLEAAVKAGVKVQEDSWRLLLDLVGDPKTPQEWREKGEAAMARLVPMASKNIEQAARLVNENIKAGLEMLAKAIEPASTGAIADAQEATRQAWEKMLSAFQQNAQTVLDANAHAIRSWQAALGELSSRQGNDN